MGGQNKLHSFILSVPRLKLRVLLDKRQLLVLGETGLHRVREGDVSILDLLVF